jgi:hypothetical protein
MAIEARIVPPLACRCGRPVDRPPAGRSVVRCECGEKVAYELSGFKCVCESHVRPGDDYFDIVLQATTLKRCRSCGLRMRELKRLAAEDEVRRRDEAAKALVSS